MKSVAIKYHMPNETGFVFARQTETAMLAVSLQMCAEFFIESPLSYYTLCENKWSTYMNDRLAWLIVWCMDDDDRVHTQSIQNPWAQKQQCIHINSIQFNTCQTEWHLLCECVSERVERVHSPSKYLNQMHYMQAATTYNIIPLIRSLKMLWHAMT